jgi:hypothetical protein
MHAVIVEDKMQEPLPTGLETSTETIKIILYRVKGLNPF